jgi:hypothetical protein
VSTSQDCAGVRSEGAKGEADERAKVMYLQIWSMMREGSEKDEGWATSCALVPRPPL